MRGKTYVYFNGKTEYIGTGGEEQTAYPLGSLVFGTLDVDWEPYLEQARALRRAYTGVDFGETCTMPQRLSEPETCVYYQVAEFYHNMSLSVKTVSPAFFDLLEGYCLAVWRERYRLVTIRGTPEAHPPGKSGDHRKHYGRLLPELSGIYRADEVLHRMGDRGPFSV